VAAGNIVDGFVCEVRFKESAGKSWLTLDESRDGTRLGTCNLFRGYCIG
jgi:hypothetical protein